MYLPLRGNAYYANLQRCSYARLCPLCGARIARRRKEEVAALGKAVLENGGVIYSVVLTARHTSTDRLAGILKAMRAAARLLSNNRKALSKRPGWLGMARNLGLTYGSNGWNAHWHAQVYLAAPDETFPEFLLQRWQQACAVVGLYASPYRSLVQPARDHEKNAWYIMQHDDRETDKDDGLSPWQLLERAKWGEAEAIALWEEYAAAVYGQRLWQDAHHLRKKLGLGEAQSDEELNQERLTEDDPVLELSQTAWREVVRTGQQAAILIRYKRK